MATLSEISAKDFQESQSDPIASKEYNSLPKDKQMKYKEEYIEKFSEEFKILRSKIMESEQIDLKSAGQILLYEIKSAHSKGEFFMDASGNVDTNKFNQLKTNIEHDVENGKYDNLIQKNKVESETKLNIEKITNFSDLQTLEDKKNWFNQNIADISSWSKNEQNALMGIYTILDEKKQAKEQYMNDGYSESESEEMAKKDVAKKYSIDEASITRIEEEFKEEFNNLTFAETEEKKQEALEKLHTKIKEKYADIDLSDEKDINKIIEIIVSQDKEKLEEINEEYAETEIDGIRPDLNESKAEEMAEENFTEMFGIDIEQEFGKDLNNPAKIEEIAPTDENNIDNIIEIIETAETGDELETSQEDELDDLGNMFGIEEVENEVAEKTQDLNAPINSIMAGKISQEELTKDAYIQEVPEPPLQQFITRFRNRFFNQQQLLNEGKMQKNIELTTNDLNQEDYTQEVKENIFSRIKKNILKLIHKNNISTIDTSENNTPTTEGSEQTNDNPWRLSGTTLEKVLNDTNKVIENLNKNGSDKNNSAKNSTIEIASAEELNI